MGVTIGVVSGRIVLLGCGRLVGRGVLVGIEMLDGGKLFGTSQP